MNPKETADKALEFNPKSLLTIGYKDGGQINISWSDTPFEVLCYMKEVLDMTVKDAMVKYWQSQKVPPPHAKS
jgi:hypothetical protein